MTLIAGKIDQNRKKTVNCKWLNRNNFVSLHREIMKEGLKSSSLIMFRNMIDSKKIKALVEEWLDGKDYFFVDATVDKENRIVVEIDHKDGVWIEDCCDLSRFIEEHMNRDEEDFELEVGSAGIGQPLKVLQQYKNNIGSEVEVMTAEGKKLQGVMTDANESTFTICYQEKQKVEGKKRPVAVEVTKEFKYDEVKWVKAVIRF